MRYLNTLAFAAALCLLSACSSTSPTGPSDLRSDDSPHPLGSGNRTNGTVAGESGILVGSGNATATPTAQASGHPIGTGNNTGSGTTTESTTDGSGDATTEDSPFPLGSGNNSATLEEAPFPLGSGN